MLVKLYGPADGQGNDRRYSPATCKGTSQERLRVTLIDARLNGLRRATEPNDADVDAPIHAPDQCVLKEGGKPYACDLAALHALQLRADS